MFPMSRSSTSRATAQGRMSRELQVAAAEAWFKSHVSHQSRILITGSISSPRQGKVVNPVQSSKTGWRQDSRQVNQKGPKSRQETGLEMYTYSIAQAHHKDTA